MNRRRLGFALFVMTGFCSRMYGFDFTNINADKVVSGGSQVVKAASGISDQDEIAIGKDVAQNMEAKYGVDADAKRTAYVDMVGQSLAKLSSRNTIPYHFKILKSDEINAFAAPGGYIFVTDGILDFVKDEAELAGVLGHEINHVAHKHVVKAIQKANLLAAGADFTASYGSNPELRAQLATFTTNLLLKGLSRQDELEADSYGTELMAKGGYTPVAMRETMARLGQMEGKSSVMQHMNQTHPPAADRVVVINRVIESKHLPITGQRQKARFESQLRKA